MILKNAKTVQVSDEPFHIPNTEIYIWKIKLEVDGEREIHNTMSKAIATEGFEGDVEVYTNDKGKDYVRQAPKENKAGGYQKSPEDKEDIARAVALKAAVEAVGYYPKTGDFPDTLAPQIIELADVFLAWLKGERPATEAEKQPDRTGEDAPARDWENVGRKEDKIIPVDDNEEINLADIPF